MQTITFVVPETVQGDDIGLYGRLPPQLQKLVRKICDAPNYDMTAMELLDAGDVQWREE